MGFGTIRRVSPSSLNNELQNSFDAELLGLSLMTIAFMPLELANTLRFYVMNTIVKLRGSALRIQA